MPRVRLPHAILHILGFESVTRFQRYAAVSSDGLSMIFFNPEKMRQCCHLSAFKRIFIALAMAYQSEVSTGRLSGELARIAKHWILQWTRRVMDREKVLTKPGLKKHRKNAWAFAKRQAEMKSIIESVKL